MRRLLAVLALMLVPSSVFAAGTIVCQGGTCTGTQAQANVWTQIQTFDAGLDIRYSSVLFHRLTENSSGNLLLAATEKAPGASTAALAGLGAGNVNSGTHSYKVTFVTAGGETDAGAVSGTVTTTAGDGQVALSAIPTGSVYVTSRKVYRTAAGNAVTGPWLLLATIANNTTTTYADNIADASLTTAIPTANTAIDTRMSLLNTGVLNLDGISPTMTFTDATASAKSLTIAVDANLAQLRESAGASGSLLVLDLANNRVGIGTASPTAVLDVTGTVYVHGGPLTVQTLTSNIPYVRLTNSSLSVIEWAFGLDASDTFNIFRKNASSVWSSALFTVNNVGRVGIGITSPASLLDLRAGDLTMSGANGQKYVQGRATELVAVGSGISTKETTIQIPADAIVDVVSVRVKTQPGGTSTVVVTSTTSGDQFQKGASISTVAGTTDPGTKGTPRNYNSVAAQTVTLTFDAPTTDALGEIRVDLVYRTMTPATS